MERGSIEVVATLALRLAGVFLILYGLVCLSAHLVTILVVLLFIKSMPGQVDFKLFLGHLGLGMLILDLVFSFWGILVIRFARLLAGPLSRI